MNLHYDWQASLLTLVIIFAAGAILKYLVLLIPALKQSQMQDSAENERKLTQRAPLYSPRVKPAQQVGMATYLFSHIFILPFLVTMAPQPLWRIALDVFLILMVYDLVYYVVHRYYFHGTGYLRQVHAVHHQARSRVSSIDSHLLHPMEVLIGIGLYYLTIVFLGLLGMAPFSVASIVVSSVIYVQLNTFNHCRFDLDRFPYRLLNWIAMKHDAHHLDMRHGNYATITLLYDKLFGTYEIHPRELEGKGEAGGTPAG